MGSSCVKPSVAEEHRRVIKAMMPPEAYWTSSSAIAVSVSGEPRGIAEDLLEKIHRANAKKAVEINVLGCSIGVLLPVWTAQRAFERFSSLPSLISVPAVHGEDEGHITLIGGEGCTRHLTASFCSPSYIQKPPSFLMTHSFPLRSGADSEIIERFEHCTVSLVSGAELVDVAEEGYTVISRYVGVPSCHATLAISAAHAIATSAGHRRVVLIGSKSDGPSKTDGPSREERIEHGVLSILEILQRDNTLHM